MRTPRSVTATTSPPTGRAAWCASSIDRAEALRRRDGPSGSLQFCGLDADERSVHDRVAGRPGPAARRAGDCGGRRAPRDCSRARCAGPRQDDGGAAPSDRTVAHAWRSVYGEAAAGRRARRARPAAPRDQSERRPPPRAGRARAATRTAAWTHRGHGPGAPGASWARPTTSAAVPRVPGRVAAPGRRAPALLPTGPAPFPGRLARAGGGELRRVGLRPHSLRELRRRAGADAVLAG